MILLQLFYIYTNHKYPGNITFKKCHSKHNFCNPVVTAGECSLFGGFTQSQQETVIFTVVLNKLHTDVLQMCTQMLLADEYTDVVYVCRCVLVMIRSD